MDLVGPIIDIAKCVGGPIVRYLKHQIKFNDSLEEFKRRKDDLCSRKRDIESKLGTEPHHGKVAKEEVQRWLNDAETFITRSAVEDEANGWGCLSCCCRVKILEERVQELKEIYDKGDRYTNEELKEIYDKGDRYTNEGLVIDDPSASVVELPTEELQGSEAVKANILAGLRGEEVTMLGVWGMGGVGKTTIMMHVHNELLKEGKFKKAIWVTVSQNFDIYNLQDQIATSLKENLEELQNATNRAGVLSKMLEKQKPYLLILDDVWSSFKLEDVGILEPNVTNGCKLVLTTRSQEVARSMDCRTIQVTTLSEEEALKLFLNKVGDTALSCPGGGIKKDLESTLKKIVDECDGLPLALITVAGSLKGIFDSQLWSLALNQLRNYKRNVAGTYADAFQILKFSYDCLEKQQIQYCFLYCALYPEDYKILKEEIIESWIDEGFIDEMESRQLMRGEGYGIWKKLVDRSLLELIEDEDSRECVRMHDLVRDMALDITTISPRFLVEAGKALEELPERVNCAEGVEKVSLMHNYIQEIPLSMASSTCTRLTTLLLAYNKLSTIPKVIFERMPELKILDLSFNWQLRSLPNSISKLVKLTTLLLESTSLRKVPSLSGLRFLKKLNLRRTKVKGVPKGLGMLTNLKCLFLSGSGQDNILEIPEGILSNLSELQELFVEWSRIELKGEVVDRLMKLEFLHGRFPSVNDMRAFLECVPNKLSRYFITVGSNLESRYGRMIDAIEMVPGYKKIMVFVDMFVDTSIIGENTLFPYMQVLCIVGCHNVRSLNDFFAIKDVIDLRRCSIYGCKGVEYVLSSWINPIAQTLEKLDLYALDNLEGLFEAEVIAKSPPPSSTFSSIKEVKIEGCKKIKKMFPSWKLVECLRNLEEIIVCNCKQMEEIIASDSAEGEKGGVIKLILPKLERLHLELLPALKSICSTRVKVVCDSLEHIQILQCYHLDNLNDFLEVEWNSMSSPPPSTCSSLKTIRIDECSKIKKLFSSRLLLGNHQSLEEINVRYCEQMEELVASDPEEELVMDLILPKLKLLQLEGLPVLKSI